MSRQKYYYYIGVLTSDGIRLVTGTEGTVVFWKDNEKPIHFNNVVARDIMNGLNLNYITACVMTFPFELEHQIGTKLVEDDL